MLHLPIVENRIAQFAARFAPVPSGGYAWFRNDWSDGLPVSESELTELLASHAMILRRTERAMRWWLGLAFVLVLALVFVRHGGVSQWWGAALFALPLPWVFLEWVRAERLPVQLTDGRRPVAPARGLREGAEARLAALPVMVPMLMLGIGSLLLWKLWQAGQLASDMTGSGVGIGVSLFGLAILWLKVVRRA
ncbi:MAG: hypothetical protein KGL44_00420 [Sphingomonadales bacterium]|nr:hypothetical protein [Sphingomonadales bacterium]